MSQANPIYSSFNAGELSPLLGGAPQLAKYQAGLSVCRNFIPRVQGAITRRGGTRFVAECKGGNAPIRPRLARFVFAANDAFVLEFGNTYIRFYKDHGQLLFDPRPWQEGADYAVRAFVSNGTGDAERRYFARVAGPASEPTGDSSDWRPEGWDADETYATGDVVALRSDPDDVSTRIYYYARQGSGPGAKAVTPGLTGDADDQAVRDSLATWHAMQGDIYEVPAPYRGSILSNADGSMAIRYTQSGDVIYLVHPQQQPQKLTRRGDIDWLIEPLVLDGGPFKDMNEDEDSTVRLTAYELNNSTDITATKPIFQPGHVGGLFYVEIQDGSNIKPWEVYQPIAFSEVRLSDGKYYGRSAPDPTAFDQYTGTEKPIHTSGKYWDGDGKDKDTDDNMGPLGVEWEYLHPGYGWVLITSVMGPLQAHGIVLSRLPQEVVPAPDVPGTTWRWALPAWSDADGWPSSVAFFRDRLAFGQGQTVWFSQAGDYQNFKSKDFGEQLASSSFGVLVQSGHGDPVAWLAPTQRLLAGTGGSVHAIGESSTAQPFGPTNARQEDQVMPGASGVQPVSAGAVLYAEVSGRTLDAAVFSAEEGRFTAQDITAFAEHITLSGVTAMAFAKQPHAVNWCVRADGRLVGLTFNKEQQVIGWHQQLIGGDFGDGPAVVEDVTVIPSPEVRDQAGNVTVPGGVRDEVWLVVKRTIHGQMRRYVEYVVPEFQDGDEPGLAAYADAHLVYDGDGHATDILTGLDHLAGCRVQVKADGASHRDLTVAWFVPEGEDEAVGDWRITLDAPATQIVVGLAAPARAKLMPLEAGNTLGTSQARIKRVNRATFRLVSSLGGAVGPDFSTLFPLEYRTPTGQMDAAPPIFTGDKSVEFAGDYDAVATIAIECDQGFPFTLVAIMPELVTYEG